MFFKRLGDRFIILGVTVLLLVSGAALCLTAQAGSLNKPYDPLAKWNEGKVKTALLDFVHQVTDTGGDHYVRPEERIAVFDYDGTVGCEIPFSIDIMAAVYVLHDSAKANPSLRDIQPYKSAYNWLKSRGTIDSNYIVNHMDDVKIKAFPWEEGGLVPFYERYIATFMSDTSLVRRLLYRDLAYVPMINLIEYLLANDFRVYLVSGSETPCLRVITAYAINPQFADTIREIEREHIIGSTVDLEFIIDGEVVYMRRRNEYHDYPINSGVFKPINIYLQIGYVPLLAFGNSMGDLCMLQYTYYNYKLELLYRPHIELLLVHDDPAREFNYHDTKFEQIAKEYGWRLVSMKNDFKEVFRSSETE